MSSTVTTSHRPANGSFANLLDRLTGLSNDDFRLKDERAVNGINGDLYASEDDLPSAKETLLGHQANRGAFSSKDLRSRDTSTPGASQLSYERAIQLHSRNQTAPATKPNARLQPNSVSGRQASEESILRQVRSLAEAQEQDQAKLQPQTRSRPQKHETPILSPKPAKISTSQFGRSPAVNRAAPQKSKAQEFTTIPRVRSAPLKTVPAASRPAASQPASRSSQNASAAAAQQTRRFDEPAKPAAQARPVPQARPVSQARSSTRVRAQDPQKLRETSSRQKSALGPSPATARSRAKNSPTSRQLEPAPIPGRVAASSPNVRQENQSSPSSRTKQSAKQDRSPARSSLKTSALRSTDRKAPAQAAPQTRKADLQAKNHATRSRLETPIPGQWRPARTDSTPRFYEAQSSQRQDGERQHARRRNEVTPAQKRPKSTHSSEPGNSPYNSLAHPSHNTDDAQLSDTRITDLIGQLRAASHPGFDNQTEGHTEVEQRTATISVRLNDHEFSLLRHRAAESGISISAYMRSCVLEAEQLRAEVKQALAEMRAVSRPAEPAKHDEESPDSAPRGAWPSRFKQLAGLLMTPLFLTRHKV